MANEVSNKLKEDSRVIGNPSRVAPEKVQVRLKAKNEGESKDQIAELRRRYDLWEISGPYDPQTDYLTVKEKEKVKTAIAVYLTTLGSSSIFTSIIPKSAPIDFGIVLMYAAIIAIFPAAATIFVTKAQTA